MTAIERWALWLTTVATAGTGTAYMWMKYFMEPLDEWAVINHPLEPLMLKLHIVSAPVLVFVFGAVLARHVIPQLRNDKRPMSKSGLLVASGIAPMVLTGYLIQVVTHEPALKMLAATHIALGVTYVVILGVHALRRSPAPAQGRTVRERVQRPPLDGSAPAESAAHTASDVVCTRVNAEF